MADWITNKKTAAPELQKEEFAGLTRRALLTTSLAGAAYWGLNPGSALAQTACVPSVCNIYAGRTTNIGSISVSNDNTYLYINVTLISGWSFLCSGAGCESLKIWVGSDLTTLPGGGTDRPPAGQFPFKYDATGSHYNVAIPLTDSHILGSGASCSPIQLYVVAHLDVQGPTSTETAFGGCTAGPGPAWWFYMAYTLCCNTTPPPVLGGCQTAFAKGEWVWTTDPKSNPENLKTLGLTKNRWGWAINLTAAGHYEFKIYAGAGLNNTSNGVEVGKLVVDWDNMDSDPAPDNIKVRYELSAGYILSETHLYAASSPPKTTAPGQYGNLHYFSAAQSVSTDQYILPLADDNVADQCGTSTCKGVWLVAHAIVCNKTS